MSTAGNPEPVGGFGPLGTSSIVPQIPVTNLARARGFYVDRLGLVVVDERVPGVVLLEAGNRSRVLLYARSPVRRDHAVAGFIVGNLQDAVAQLRAAGVGFISFAMPDGTPVDGGVAQVGAATAGWFKDSEGNILSLNARS